MSLDAVFDGSSPGLNRRATPRTTAMMPRAPRLRTRARVTRLSRSRRKAASVGEPTGSPVVASGCGCGPASGVVLMWPAPGGSAAGPLGRPLAEPRSSAHQVAEDAVEVVVEGRDLEQPGVVVPG